MKKLGLTSCRQLVLAYIRVSVFVAPNDAIFVRWIANNDMACKNGCANPKLHLTW